MRLLRRLLIALWVLAVLTSGLVAYLCYLTIRMSSTAQKLVTVEGDMKAGNDIRIGEPK
jgi:hypothetical protein